MDMTRPGRQGEIERLRHDLKTAETDDLWRRRAIIGLSLAGMASMAAVSLLQTGIVRRLPDPPIPRFNSCAVNSSDTAYALGVPDGTLSLASFAANVPLAAWGTADRAQEQPWIPLAIAGKAAVEAIVSSWYFLQMPLKEKAWCGYCVVAALASAGVFALTLPEARTALAALQEQKEVAA